MSASQVVAERFAFVEADLLACDLKDGSLSHPSEGSREPEANPERFSNNQRTASLLSASYLHGEDTADDCCLTDWPQAP